MVSLPIAISYRLYRASLLLYPREFREEYSREMALVFRDCCRDTHRSRGTAGLPTVWGAAMLDLVTNAVKEHVVPRPRPTAAAQWPWRRTLRCSFCSEEMQPGTMRCAFCGAMALALSTRRGMHVPPRPARKPAGYLMVQIATDTRGFYDWAHGELDPS